MTVLRHALFSLVSLCLLCLPAAAETLTFAPLALESQEVVMRQMAPMLRYLEADLGLKLRSEFRAQHQQTLEAFQRHEIDLALLGPLPYIQLRAACPAAEPLLVFLDKDGQSTYTCGLFTWMDSGIDSVAAMRGKRFALTQPHSTCGYLGVEMLLRPHGLSLESSPFRYLGGHDKVALAVVRGELDVGGVKASIGRKYESLGLRQLAETPPLSGFLLVANSSTVAPERMKAIGQSLLRLQPRNNPEDRALTENWGEFGRYGAAPARDSDYDVLRSLVDQVAIPEQGTY